MEKIKLYTHEEMLDRVVGEKGTSRRDAMEAELQSFLIGEAIKQARKEKEAKKKQKIIEIKEVRLSPNIDTNDLNTKTSAARKFLEKGDKVKVTLRFRGREMAHMSKSRHILDDFANALSDIAVIDKPSKVEGRSMVMFLTAKR